jgi:hypothetical protein
MFNNIDHDPNPLKNFRKKPEPYPEKNQKSDISQLLFLFDSNAFEKYYPYENKLKSNISS